MSRYIAKYMNLKKSKRPIFWNGENTILYHLIYPIFFAKLKRGFHTALNIRDIKGGEIVLEITSS